MPSRHNSELRPPVTGGRKTLRHKKEPPLWRGFLYIMSLYGNAPFSKRRCQRHFVDQVAVVRAVQAIRIDTALIKRAHSLN